MCIHVSISMHILVFDVFFFLQSLVRLFDPKVVFVSSKEQTVVPLLVVNTAICDKADFDLY